MDALAQAEQHVVDAEMRVTCQAAFLELLIGQGRKREVEMAEHLLMNFEATLELARDRLRIEHKMLETHLSCGSRGV